jgi:hypothetical protein
MRPPPLRWWLLDSPVNWLKAAVAFAALFALLRGCG